MARSDAQVKQNTEDQHHKIIKPSNYNLNLQNFCKWHPQRFQTEYASNPKPWSYRVPLNSLKPFNPLNGKFIQRETCPNNSNGHYIHYQET